MRRINADYLLAGWELMAKRDVEISAPTFDSLEESLEYTRRFQNPQEFIDEFVKLHKGRIELSADPKYDPRIIASGSAVILQGQEISLRMTSLYRSAMKAWERYLKSFKNLPK